MHPSDLGFRLRFLGHLAALTALLAAASPAPLSAQAEDDADESTDEADADETPAPEGATPTRATDDAADNELAAPPPDTDEEDAADELAAPPPRTDAEAEQAAEAASDEGATAEEEAAAAAATPAASAEPKVWRNSFFFWSNDVSAYTFLPNTPNAPNQYNPSYSWSFSVQPRWYVGPSLFLRLRQDASIEWTQSDFRTRDRELVLNDTILDLLEGNLANLFGITFSLGGRFIIPTSIASQNNTMTFGAGLIGLARYSVPDVLKGLTLIVSTAYIYRHFDKNTGQFQDAALQPPVSSGPLQVQNSQLLANQPHSYGLGLSAVLAATSSLFFSGSFSWNRGWAHGVAGGCVDTDCQVTLADSDAERRRDTLFFSIGGSYQFNQWLNVGLSMSTPTTLFIASARDRNAIWNYDTTFSLTTQITLDQLYSDLFETKESGRTVLPGQPF